MARPLLDNRMKIGIDARLIEETGVGRYIRNLIEHLGVVYTKNQYVIFLRKKSYTDFSLPNNRFEKRLADVSWHSIAEQFFMPWILVKEHLDLVHIPYFNVPIFYPGLFIVTIHDLTILHYDTGKATTLPLFLYKIRRLGYYVTLMVGLVRAKAIIAVSETTKKEIMDHFQIPSEKITVTYEGVDEKVKSQKSKVKSQKSLINSPYFLYVGNAYPHKNLEFLLRAFQTLRLQPEKASPFQAKLVLVGKDDYFYQKVRRLVHTLGLDDNVVFFGQATDTELSNLYSHALALVFPSRMEGFGLPALEATVIGTPIICSDIPTFREILGPLGNYFESHDVTKISTLLILGTTGKLKKPSNEDQNALLKKFSWRQMSEKTIYVYTQSPV